MWTWLNTILKWANSANAQDADMKWKLTIGFPITKTGWKKMGRWTYFTDEEAKGLIDDLMFKLDRAREIYGFPIVITSGYRDPAHNDEVGGVKDSAHTEGKAVDIRVPADQSVRERLIWALARAGFDRMGCYDKHIHVDVSKDLPTPAFWTGISH